MENVLGIKLDLNHPGVTTQRVPPRILLGEKMWQKKGGKTK